MADLENIKFISKWDPNLKCSICFGLASQPEQCGKCGKLFCTECIEKNGRNSCPHCRRESTNFFRDIKSERDINAIEVRCLEVDKGCQWTGTYGELQSHASVCEYTEVACAYRNLGCGVRMLRKDIKKHETELDAGHFNLMLGIVQSLSEQQKELSEQETFVFKLPCYTSKKDKKEIFYSTSFYTHPGGYKMRIRVDANGEGEGAGSYLSVFHEVIEGSYDDQLHWPFLGTVTFELLNQLADNSHHRSELTCNITSDRQVGSSLGYSEFLPHSSLCHDPDTNTQYLLDDTLYFRVSVKVDNHKPWLVCTDKIYADSTRITNVSKSLKYESHYVFKMSGYELKKNSNDTFHSNSFDSSSDGYKMRLQIYPNGDGSGEGTHVSLYIKLLEGSHDANLPWPFMGTITLMLLNQLSDENHHSKKLEYTTSENGINVGNICGFSEFISHSALAHDPVRNTTYLDKDTLYFRVSVIDNTHKPWLICTM